MIQDGRKRKITNTIFKKYITLDSEGRIDFKGAIKHEINTKNISKEDALVIILELLNDTFNSKLNDFRDVSAFRFNKIKIVKSFNENPKNSENDIISLFNHDYEFEKKILLEHIHKLESKRNIQNSNVITFNRTFIETLCLPNEEIKVNLVKKTKKIKSQKPPINKKVKLKLDYLTKLDLCYILDLDPDLTFEKSKVLRKKLQENLLILDIDLYSLRNASPDKLKACLKPLRDKEKEHEKKRKDFYNLISKVKKFNNKKISEILSSKENYLKILSEINDNYENCDEKNIKYFKSYQDYIINVDELNQSLVEIDSKKEFIDNFNNDFLNCYLDYGRRENLKVLFEDYNDLIFKVNKFPIVLKNKLLNENENLKNIVHISEDLDSYISLSESDENNGVRIHNEKILDKKIKEDNEFFKDITDASKKRAIVLDEKNVRVVAGAGTGKTFTIQKKVKYLVKKQDISPDKILCLCYTNKGANELDKKVNADLDNAKVEVCTFHEFCRRVDRYCGGNKKTNRYLLDKIIRNYVKEIIQHDAEKISKISEYFSYYVTSPIEVKEFASYEELINLESSSKLISLKEKYYEAKSLTFLFQGDLIKSIAELIIANYLFLHDIDYEYEKGYEYNFVDILKRFLYSGAFLSLENICNQSNEIIVKRFIDYEIRLNRYCPTFYLPKYEIYIEHFGLRHSNNESWLHEGYEKEMKDKFLCHDMHGTNLIKTFYYNLEDGNLIEELEKQLIENNVFIGNRDVKEVMEVIMTTNDVDDYKNFNNLIKTFINIFEAKNFPKSKFKEFKNQTKFVKNGYVRKRQELFFDIITDIYEIYQEHNQKDIIDHNREISNALELIKSKKYDKSYDYILIDEYQDINLVRCNLLQELQRNTNCKIFVVGDDWQSIYKFNGSDVELFTNFNKYFSNAETVKLEENRRNTQRIIDISSKFITKNKNQEKKNLISSKEEYLPNLNPIKIVPFEWNTYNSSRNRILKLDAILDYIYENNSKKDLKILILGRINKDINKFTGNALFKEQKRGKYRKLLYSKKRNADITFMTIHQAKGLEYDEVIIVNFEGHINGFPNRIEDDSLLQSVKNYEECPYAEERRLLYVALTRTLNNVYLLSPDKDQSIFIKELKDDFKIQELNLAIDEYADNHLYDESVFFSKMEYHKTKIPCPNCSNGKITLVVNNVKGTSYFRCSNYAVPNPSHYDGGPYTGTISDLKYVEKCPKCRGILVRRGDILKCCLNSHSGCMETKELKLKQEDMEYDE